MSQDYEQMESSQRQHNEMLFHNERMCNEGERHAISLLMTLGLSPFKIGGKWGFLWGHSKSRSFAGYGDTVMEACFDFYKNLKELKA